MILDKVSDCAAEWDSCCEAIRANGITEAIAVNAGIAASHIRRALWKDDFKADALKIAEKFESVSRFHMDHTSDNWETVPADQVPSVLIS